MFYNKVDAGNMVDTRITTALRYYWDSAEISRQFAFYDSTIVAESKYAFKGDCWTMD